MKIAFMMASYDTMYFFKIMADRLKARGHTIKAFPAIPTKMKGGKYGVEHCKWHTFEVDPIFSFMPDRILVWNGYHSPFFAATEYLKNNFNLFHVEQAWIPQKGNIYIDVNIGSKSNIAKYGPKIAGAVTKEDREILAGIKKYYEPNPKVKFEKVLPEKFILVPLQLEPDTSIVLDSPYFKTMDSLIGFVLRYSKLPVVIKPHPKEVKGLKQLAFRALQDADLQGVTIIDDKNVSINDLCHRCTAVVGINSTSMVEAAVYNKPIVQFGHNVFGRADKELFTHPGVFDFCCEPPVDLYIKKLVYLYKNQISILNPAKWVLDKIENYNEIPRGLHEAH